MDAVLFEVRSNIAFITLNRPEKFNALNREMALGLQQKLADAERDPEVRCIVLAGSGKAFCAGQDLTEIKDPAGPEMKKILPEQLNPVVSKLRTIHKPVVASVHGIAAGAAANIALCCDLVIAAESAVFIQAFTMIGLIPDSGGTYMLPRLVGVQKAAGLMMLAEHVGGREAEKMGMIYRCVADDELSAETEAMAGKLAAMPTKALYYTRMAIDESLNTSFSQQLENEAAWQEKAAGTEDFREGVSAFLQKRTPQFKGR